MGDDENFLALRWPTRRARGARGDAACVDRVTNSFLCASRLNRSSSIAVGVVSQGRHLGADHRSRVYFYFIDLQVPGH